MRCCTSVGWPRGFAKRWRLNTFTGLVAAGIAVAAALARLAEAGGAAEPPEVDAGARTAVDAGAPTGAEAAPSPLRNLMLQRIVPTSDVVFRVGADEPADAAAWQRVQQAAQALADAAVQLQQAGPGDGDAVWRDSAQALVVAATAAAEAAGRNDVDAVLEIGNDIYTTCENCHATHLKGRSPQ